MEEASETDDVDEEEVVVAAEEEEEAAEDDDETDEEADAKLAEAELSEDMGDKSFSLMSIISVLFARLIF